jgi:hypothetical protein
MIIDITLDTETIKADKNTSAANAAKAVVQYAAAMKQVATELMTEQNRIVKAFGLNEGLSLDKVNACGKGSVWAKARAQLSSEIETAAKGLDIGLTKRASCDRAANRALNKAGFKSRERIVLTDWLRAMIVQAMNHVAKRVDGKANGAVESVTLDEVVALFGEGTPAAKAAEQHFDDLCVKEFGLELTEA